MSRVEKVKEVIKGLSVSDRSDVLLYILRLEYYKTLEGIAQLSIGQKSLPETDVDSLTYDELLEQLLFLEGIRAGLQDSKEGRVISHNDIKKQFAQWRMK